METPEWLDKKEYPFQPHYFETTDGKMHYVDEGTGEPIVFVHGTPVWSYVYRNFIKAFSGNYRCLAADHLGFGLSEKPTAADYSVDAHAKRLEQWLESLNLENITLVVHDFGGPIGLYYALQHPEKVKKLVVLNTWMWPLEEEKSMAAAGKFFGSSFGRFLYTVFNFSPKYLVRKAFYDLSKFTPDLHRHYLQPFAHRQDRLSTWVLARELVTGNPFFESLWQQREKLAGKEALILWGEKDAFIPKHFLERWQQVFRNSKVKVLPCGHFVQEEQPEAAIAAMKDFLGN